MFHSFLHIGTHMCQVLWELEKNEEKQFEKLDNIQGPDSQKFLRFS